MKAARQFIQGERDAELFGAVGPLLVERGVHASLGTPVTADPGDVWLIVPAEGPATGFAIARRGDDAHLRHLYSANDGDRKRLLMAVEKWARSTGASEVYTIDRAGWWSSAGYTPTPARGSYLRWTKGLAK